MKTDRTARVCTALALGLVLSVFVFDGKRCGAGSGSPAAAGPMVAKPAIASLTGAVPAAPGSSGVRSVALSRPVSLSQGAAEVPDPDHVGPCPKDHSPVVWRGLDSNGQPMWRHADGSMTVRAKQDYTHTDGKHYVLPRVVTVFPTDRK
ncbi:MAG: hypothetical protein KDC87_05135 [Planctomycetes bacterium]|nr:hypothetical protein [Planctomycetota bacterium]MCB9869998.1 hypothetical protein [Planctomycetota bacterium]